MTNGDKIRQMSDEELVALIDSFGHDKDDRTESLRKDYCNKCKRENLHVCDETIDADDCTVKAIEDWIKQEV